MARAVEASNQGGQSGIDFDAVELPSDWALAPFPSAILPGHSKIAKVKSSDYKLIGRFPIVDQGQTSIAGYADDASGLFDGTLPVIVCGDHTRIFKFVDFPFLAGADGTQILQPNTKAFDPCFLYFSLSCLRIPSRGYNRHFSIVKEKKLPKPPLDEQRAIAHILRTVQRAKEATEKVIAATRQLKASLMRHLFTYGPVAFHEADQVRLKETDFGLVPQSWRILALNDCSKVQTGVAKGRRLNGTETISVPYLRVANVQDGYLDLSEMKSIEIRSSELERYSLQAGDVVLTEGGDFDKLGRGFIWNGEVILYAANSGTFPNVWNLCISSVSISPLWTVGRSSRHRSMAVVNCPKSS